MGRKSQAQAVAEKEMASFNKNYATNQSICDRAYQYVIDPIKDARNGRRAKEEEWLEDLRLWSCQNSDSQMYMGRSNLIVPELNNQVESSVNKFMDGLFPNDDYIGCIPNKLTNADEADDIKDAVFHELDHKNDLPSLSERFQRQKVLYGTAFFKPVFEKSMKTVIVQDDKGYPKPYETPKYQGVRVHCLDTFHTYVWPETVNTVEEAQIAFDEDFINKRVLEKTKLYKNLDKVSEVNPDYSDFSWIDNARLTLNNLSSASNARRDAVLVTECWCDFDIVPGEYVPCVITLANYQTIIRVERNPFWHQSKPYLMGRYLKGPAGETYGHSLSERLRSLQYMMTDIANQTMDSLTFSLNPIVLIDPGFAGDVNSFKLQPGARWFASPQGVRFESFPDISGAGFQGMQQVRAMIQQFSDLATDTAPQLSGKVRSATQANAVQGEISQNLRNMVRADEFDVYSPLCDMTHWLLKQFQTEEYQILTQGPEKGQWITKTVNPKTLQKDAIFTWRGSEVAQASAIRNQQILSGYNLAMQTERVMPGTIDLPELLKAVFYETFNLKDLNVVIKDREKRSVDPKIENISLKGGDDCPVNPGDVYAEHMRVHEEGFNQSDDQLAKLAFLKHMERHEVQKKAKDILAQQQAQMEAMKAELGNEQQEAGGMPQGGNQSQISSQPSQIMQGMRGSEPNL